MGEGHRYHRDTPGAESERIAAWVPAGARVLELGCHTGSLSRLLASKDCRVTGVDQDQSALALARPFLSRALALDIDGPALWEELAQERFDAICWIHVLEHLRDPADALSRSVHRLADDGTAIIGLPNVSNARQRFAMLFGHFEYEEIGVMDRTHLRFFNHETAQEFLAQCGLAPIEYVSSWQTNPTRQLLNHLPVLHRLSRYMREDTPPRFPRYSRNLTDVTMLFRCRRRTGTT